MNIILCGMPGSGKTTVGKLLSGRLSMNFADTDALIERKYGQIARLFETQGESFFREIETETFRALLKEDGCVIATGGGIVTRAENRELMAGKRVFYLASDMNELCARLANDDTRYLLRGDLRRGLETLMRMRAPLYEEVGVRIETKGKTPSEIASAIEKEVMG